MANIRSSAVSFYRKEIDQIDLVIAQLLEARILRVRKIEALKKLSQLPKLDRQREQDVAHGYFRTLKKISKKSRIQKLTQAIIALNPNYPISNYN